MACPVCGQKLDYDFKLRFKQCHGCGWRRELQRKNQGNVVSLLAPQV